jgi:hypothetical protein
MYAYQQTCLSVAPSAIDVHTPLAYGAAVIFVESPAFCRWRDEHLDDDHFRALQNVLIINPLIGTVIQGSGGLRKLRIALRGRGKRGGARLIYYWWAREDRCYLLYAYAKNVRDDLTAEQRRQLAAAMSEEIHDG